MFRFQGTLILVAFAAASCASQPARTVDEHTHQKDTPKVELYTFDCGRIDAKDLGPFASNGALDGRTDSLSNPCFLIRHTKGDLLWDLGMPSALAESGPQEGEFATFSLERTLTTQLAGIGVTPSDIEYVALSHYHIDHAGQVEVVAGAQWLVEAREYASIMGGDELPHAADLDALRALDAKVFEGEHDVFGDGSVVIVSTPGHTSGHVSLFVTLREAGVVALSGDLYLLQKSREKRLVPTINASAEQTLRSMDTFEKRVTELGARVIVQHDRKDVGSLPRPPKALR